MRAVKRNSGWSARWIWLSLLSAAPAAIFLLAQDTIAEGTAKDRLTALSRPLSGEVERRETVLDDQAVGVYLARLSSRLEMAGNGEVPVRVRVLARRDLRAIAPPGRCRMPRPLVPKPNSMTGTNAA